MRISVFADFVCPWCYIGKRRLERALALRGVERPDIHWLAFRLDPNLPLQGVDRRQYMAAKFGGLERLKPISAGVTAAAEREGLQFDLDGQTRVPNTLAAHRLMRLAERYGLGNPLAEMLFAAYFVEARDIGTPAVLAELAVRVGLPQPAVRSFLAGAEEAESVETLDALARQNGINGVPFFIFDRRFAMAGAQEPEAFLPIFDAIAAAAAAEPISA